MLYTSRTMCKQKWHSFYTRGCGNFRRPHSTRLFGIIPLQNLGINDCEETKNESGRQRHLQTLDALQGGGGGVVLCTQAYVLWGASGVLFLSSTDGELSTFFCNGVRPHCRREIGLRGVRGAVRQVHEDPLRNLPRPLHHRRSEGSLLDGGLAEGRGATDIRRRENGRGGHSGAS